MAKSIAANRTNLQLILLHTGTRFMHLKFVHLYWAPEALLEFPHWHQVPMEFAHLYWAPEAPLEQ